MSDVLSVALRIVLGSLAVYHLAMGAIALFAPDAAWRLVRALYGASLADTAPTRYMTSMIGAFALAIGALAAVALFSTTVDRPILGALLVLQAGRLFCRVRDRRLLVDAIGMTTRANAVASALLAAESVVLLLGLR